MTMFVQTDPTGLGTGTIDSDGVMVDLMIIANDTGLGFDAVVGGRQAVTYARTLGGVIQLRLDALVNTTFQPDYGAGPQNVDIVVLSLPDNFVFGDGTFALVNNGTALAPTGSGVAGADLNPTTNCLVLYDTELDVCVARDGTGGTLDLPLPGPVVLYHELSHAFRIVTNSLLALTAGCDPSSPEENAAIVEENDMRQQIAGLLDLPAELRDPNNHCGGICGTSSGGCCIVASVVTGSPLSVEVQRLRAVRDGFVRRMESGHDFFQQLHYDYYSFSPQVCTMIAADLSLQQQIRVGFVEPLMDFWEFMALRTRESPRTAQAFGALIRQHFGRTDLRTRSVNLNHVSEWWSDGSPNNDLPAELRELLNERAWPSPIIQWALVRPLEIELVVVNDLLTGMTDTFIGERLLDLLRAWTVAIPIGGVWGSLPSEKLGVEIALFDQGLLQDDLAELQFRRRLLERFPTVTAIQKLMESQEDL